MKRILAILISSVVMTMAGRAAEPAKAPSVKEIRILSEKASTPAEHMRIAQYYRTEADRLQAEAALHTEMAQKYRAQPTVSEVKRPMSPDTARHCEYFADKLHQAADEARVLADEHTEMAKK